MTLRVHATGICGTDLHVCAWHGQSLDWLGDLLPVTLGHEFSGTVIKAGPDVETFHQGDRVTVQSQMACGNCAPCMSALPDQCHRPGFIGITCDGAFAPRVIVPTDQCWHLPTQVDLELGAIAEPLAVSLNALRTGTFEPGQDVLVLGPGMIGMGIAVLASLLGARSVTVAGFGDEPRLARCRQLGIDHTVDLEHDALVT